MKELVVHWEKLLPKEFFERQQTCSVVYLPLGMCEPHGHIAPFGLDTLKAEYLCEAGAQRFGGIVAPTLGYQIHECGYHARWLQDVVGEKNAAMTAMPPDVMLRFFIYQLRAFANSGFSSILVLSGHAGGNQQDFRLVANAFAEAFGVAVEMYADPELVEGKYEGDHAGKYEISQLLYLRPELMDMDRVGEVSVNPLGQYAQGEDAKEASADLGKDIMEACLASIGKSVEAFRSKAKSSQGRNITYQEVEAVWQKIEKKKSEWVTLQPWEGQEEVDAHSKWKSYESLD